MNNSLRKKIKIGDLLLQENLITDKQLENALQVQKQKGGKLGTILIHLKYIDENKLLKTLGNQLNLPFVDLQHYQIKPDIICQLPERIARRYRVILFDIVEGDFLVGLADPTDLLAYDEVAKNLQKKIRFCIVKESDLLRVFDQVYRRTKDIASFANELREELVKEDLVDNPESGLSANAAPVVRLLESIFEDALQVGASDIHIEPDEKVLRIRQRIDGVLQENILQNKEIAAALVLKIKLMSKLNISEKRIPQDGRFHMAIKNHSIDVRVSTMPLHYGEAVVMRLLDQSKGILDLNQLGMSEDIYQRFKALIQKPHGMILVTGPTGSGKTTTLYAALNGLNTSERKIITIEDPVEYTLPRVNQTQVNPNIGLTFQSILRSVLRQDPDIIMVGEMRDEETVKIGLRASITGHLVLSTLHTNDAISTVMRLMDMKAEDFLVASAVRGILAQRLIRKICDTCLVDNIPTYKDREWLKNIIDSDIEENLIFKKSPGCARCNQTGYRGRIGVYELIEMDEKLSEALHAHDKIRFIKEAKAQKNYQPLAISAYHYAKLGMTTLQEVFRVASGLFEEG